MTERVELLDLHPVTKLEWALAVIETEFLRLRAENKALYDELNRILGARAPEAWDRVKKATERGR